MAIPEKKPYERLSDYLERSLPAELEAGKSRGKATADIIAKFNEEPPREMFAPFIWGNASVSGSSEGFTGLLDTYSGATIAYSLRKLSSSSTNAVEVRRSSDSALLDVGFVGEDLDTASLLSWAGADTVYVSKWYDQSGNSNDFIQTTTTEQPLIVNGGTVESVNGKSAMTFDGTDDYFDLTSNYTTPSAFSTAWVFERLASGDNNSSLTTTSAGIPFLSLFFTDNNIYFRPGASTGANVVAGSGIGQHLIFDYLASSTWEPYLNGTSLGTRSYTTFGGVLNAFGNRGGTVSPGKHQEYVIWDVNQSANEVGIQANINTYYTIY